MELEPCRENIALGHHICLTSACVYPCVCMHSIVSSVRIAYGNVCVICGIDRQAVASRALSE